jgi:hypothetical protein
MKINVLAYKCSLPPQASYFIEVNVRGGIFASISKCKGNHNLLRLGYCWHCVPYKTYIIYKTTITRWENRLYSVLETTRRCQVQQFQRHQNTSVLSYDININIFFTLGILLHHHQTLLNRWTTHRRGGIIAMAWVALVETVIDMRVSILFTSLPTLNVMTLMAKYHKKKANWLWKTIQIWTIHPHSYGYKIILTHNSNQAYLRDVQTKWHTPVSSNKLSRD